MNKKHEIDVNENAIWKIDSECKNRSIPLTDEIEWAEYRIDVDASCWIPPDDLHPNSLFEVQGLGEYDEGLIRTANLSHLMGVARFFDKHLVLIPLSDLDEDCEQILKEAPEQKNVHILVTNENKEHTERLGNLRKRGFKAILRLAPPDIDAGYLLLDHIDWVLINGHGLEECPAKVISEFLERCQKQNVDCWVTGGEIPDVEFEFELPELENHVLFDSKIDYRKEVSKLQADIETAKQAVDTSGLELAYRLNKLVNIAKKRGKKAFWQLNFEVGSFSEYCDSVIGITSNLGHQYILAVKVCEALNPGFLEEMFETVPEAERPAIGYTRFRDMGKYLGELKKLQRNQPNKYDQVSEVLYNPDRSNREVLSVAKEILGVRPQVVKPKRSISDELKSLKRSMTSLGERVKARLPSDVHPDFDSLIERVIELISDQLSHAEQFSETENGDANSIMAF